MQKPSTFVANYKPYNESFDIENQIYKVLFKPSCNITSNDLNLLQSILQEQIAKFGQHFFQNGSFVSGGEFLFKDSVITFIGESDSLTISELEGLYFKHETEDLIIKIDISNLISEDSTSQLLSGKTNFVVSVVSGTLLDKESFFSTFENFYLYNQLTGSVNLEKFLKVYDYEYSSYIKFNSGIIFIDGYFVNVNQQVRLLNPLQEKPSLSVGFEIKKSIINYNDDSSLLDNAIGAPSYNSIGADRLKIELKLTLHTIIEDSNYFDITVKDNFIEYLRIKSGVIIKDVHIPVYSEFAKTLARRTYNESGNYTVKPFKIKLSDKDENNYNIEISPGKAYIFGYEMNSISTRNIELPKIKNTTSVANQKIKIPSGSYFIIDSLLTFINTNESEIINFYNSSDELVGTGACYYIKNNNDTTFSLYLCDIIPDTNKDIYTTSYLKTTLGNTIGNVLSDGLIGTPITSFKYVPSTVKYDSIESINITVQKVFESVVGNNIPILTNETFPSNEENYLIFDASGDPLIVSSVTLNLNSVDITPTAGTIASVIVSGIEIDNGESIVRTTTEKTIVVPFNFTTLLPEEVSKVKDITFNSESIIADFNQSYVNDPFEVSGLELTYRNGTPLIGNISITYEYYEYDSNGLFLETNYSLDFRKNITAPQTLFSLEPDSLIEFNCNSFAGRIDKLAINKNRNFVIISGVEGINPVPPKDRDDAMTLYTIFIPAGITSAKSISLKFHENKRYTMRDIGKLENRIENLEYYTALNLLEKETASQNILDSNGNNRFKNGFVVDNFKTFGAVELQSSDSLFSLDTKNGYLRPSFEMLPLECSVNEQSSTIVKTGDLITLPYIETPIIEQLDASGIINLNPYEVFVWEGHIQLTPENDFWVDTETKPDVTINQFGENDVYAEMGKRGFNSQFGSWETAILNVEPTEDVNSKEVKNYNDINATVEKKLWNPSVDSTVSIDIKSKYDLWVSSNFKEGFPEYPKPDGYVNNQPAILLDFKGKKEQTQEVSKNFAESTILTNSLGETVRDVAISPYIRSRDIQFTATCLKPNTTFYALFSDKNITSYCTMIDNTENRGVLISDDYGNLSGIFTIPEKTFNVGEHTFKLIDSLETNSSFFTSFGVCRYYSKGLSQTKQETLISTREPVLTTNVLSIGNDSTAELAFDTSSLVTQPKPTLTLIVEGIGNVEVKDDNGNVVLIGKQNSSISSIFDTNTKLNFFIKESSELFDSIEGDNLTITTSGRKQKTCSLTIIKDKTLIFRFKKPTFIKVKVAIEEPVSSFKTYPYPYYNISFDSFNLGIIETSLQYREALPRIPFSPTPTPSITPTLTPTPTPTPSSSPILTPTPTPTPSVTPTSSPFLTPTPTPTISLTPTITPTKSLTPTPTPTVSITPSVSRIVENTLKFDYSILEGNTIETKEFLLTEGDTISTSYFNKNTATISYMLVKNTILVWDELSETDSKITITKEIISKLKSIDSTLNTTFVLYLTPIENKAIQINLRGFGNTFNLHWIISNETDDEVELSGSISSSSSGQYIQLPEILKTPDLDFSKLRLIPYDTNTLQNIDTSGSIFYQDSQIIQHPYSPFPITNELYSGVDSDVLGTSTGVYIGDSEIDGIIFPYYSQNNLKQIKTFFIDLQIKVTPTPTPTPTPTVGIVTTPTPTPTKFPIPSFTPTPTPTNVNIIRVTPTPTPSVSPRLTIGNILETKEETPIDKTIVNRIVQSREAIGESFFIDAALFPEGVFLSSAELFFQSKDSKLPVILELRPSINSYPSFDEVIPFSRVIKPASYINISSDAKTSTKFTFPSPVYLKPGEYNFVVSSSSLAYNAWIGTIGEFKIGSTEERITSNPYTGILFKSADQKAWLPQSDSDFTFRINRCQFSTEGNVTIESNYYDSYYQGINDFRYSIIRQNAVTIIPDNTTITPISLKQIKPDYTVYNKDTLGLNDNKELDYVYVIKDRDEITKSVINTLKFKTTKDNVSPVLDSERLSLTLVKNNINWLETDDEISSELQSYGGKAKCRYIIKTVKLDSDVMANNISISFSVSMRQENRIRAYYRIYNSVYDKTGLFQEKNWIEIGTKSVISRDKNTFIDVSFQTPIPIVYENFPDISDFNYFSIKLVLESSNEAIIPLVKDLRIIALTD